MRSVRRKKIPSSNILDLAKRRRTVRRFSSDQVKIRDVVEALEAACQAPSGANSQPWRFMIITDPKIKSRVRAVCEKGEKEFYSNVRGELKEWLLSKGLSWNKPFLEEAPLLVLIFSERKAPYSIQSVWLAIGYILLALEEQGLSTVPYTPSITKTVLDEIAVPGGFRLEAILPVGVSADKKPKESRLGIHEVSYLNLWGKRLSPSDLLSRTDPRSIGTLKR